MLKTVRYFILWFWGNKINLSACQESIGKAQALCRDNSNYFYFEVSAKDVSNVTVTIREAIWIALDT